MKSLLSFALPSLPWKPLAIACLPFLFCSSAFRALAVPIPVEISSISFERTFNVLRSDPITSLQDLNDDLELLSVSMDVSEYLAANLETFDIDDLSADLALKYGSVQPYLGESEPEYSYHVDEDGIVRRSCYVIKTLTVDGVGLSQDVIVLVIEVTQS